MGAGMVGQAPSRGAGRQYLPKPQGEAETVPFDKIDADSPLRPRAAIEMKLTYRFLAGTRMRYGGILKLLLGLFGA